MRLSASILALLLSNTLLLSNAGLIFAQNAPDAPPPAFICTPVNPDACFNSTAAPYCHESMPIRGTIADPIHFDG